jgi:hypothetical protein
VLGALQIAVGVLPPHAAYWLLGKDKMSVASVHTGVLLLGGRSVTGLCWLWLLDALRIANLWHSYYHAWQSMRLSQAARAWMRPMKLVNKQFFCKTQMKRKPVE